MAGGGTEVTVADGAMEVIMADGAMEVIMAAGVLEKGAHTDRTRRMITATKASATPTVMVTEIIDSHACGIRAAAMVAGLNCQFP